MIHDLSATPLNPAQLMGALGQAALLFGGGITTPAGEPALRADAIDAYQAHVDSMAISVMQQRQVQLPASVLEQARRADALPAGVGGFPRDFEWIRSRILQEHRTALNSFALFPRDSEVPLGPRKFTTYRAVGQGEAIIHRGGSEFPQARTGFIDETHGIAYVVCAVATNFFEMLTTDWAGIRQFQQDMRLAVRLVEERLNRIAWFGDSASNIDGVINHRHLAKRVMPLAFKTGVDGDALVQSLHDLVDAPLIGSSGVFRPNRLALPPGPHRFLHTKRLTNTEGITLAEFFLKGQSSGGSGGGVRQIDMVHELAGIGPNGEDGILAYRDEVDCVGHVLPQLPTSLPVFQATPLDQQTVIFAATGGVTMYDSGPNILGLIPKN